MLLAAASALESPPAAKSPLNGMTGNGAAELLFGLCNAPQQEPEVAVEGVSRKDKSLGLLCDNFLQLFASGAADAVELEAVASTLGVGRRRIYDIVNVLESLDIVQKEKASSYTWLGISKLPDCVKRLSSGSPPVELLLDEPTDGVVNKENDGRASAASDAAGSSEGRRGSVGGSAAEKEGRKEKSIRELSTKFVGLFLQALHAPSLDGTISLEQAARSLLLHEAGGPGVDPLEVGEPDPGAMKTKVRRLYDICNVLTSLRMIEKVRLPDTSKPAFRWLGVTVETEAIFDAAAAAARPVKAYGGGVNAPVASKRARSTTESQSRRTSLKSSASSAATASAPPSWSVPSYAGAPEYAPVCHLPTSDAVAIPPSAASELANGGGYPAAQAYAYPAPAAAYPVPAGAPAAATYPAYPTPYHGYAPMPAAGGADAPAPAAPAADADPAAPAADTPALKAGGHVPLSHQVTQYAQPQYPAAAQGAEASAPAAAPSAEPSAPPDPLRSPSFVDGSSRPRGGKPAAATPAHVTAALLACGGMEGMGNTPRQATSALLTLASIRPEGCAEVEAAAHEVPAHGEPVPAM